MTPDPKSAQTDDLVRAVEELLAADTPAPDPWWQAGIDDTLEE